MFSGCKYNEKQRIGINNRCKKTFFVKDGRVSPEVLSVYQTKKQMTKNYLFSLFDKNAALAIVLNCRLKRTKVTRGTTARPP